MPAAESPQQVKLVVYIVPSVSMMRTFNKWCHTAQPDVRHDAQQKFKYNVADMQS